MIGGGFHYYYYLIRSNNETERGEGKLYPTRNYYFSE